jgi:hypothetical protein
VNGRKNEKKKSKITKLHIGVLSVKLKEEKIAI